ncbi:hypothetical protein [Pseudoduganella namucuonensis]|uniref:hypothetical protein n=1 Tax=Pseudoduganella namucuonensis TaxID=1035707 RepID=UPI000A92CFA2|nr:hypothetical protein [Pseudoduganella namucuonensis]
MRLIKAAPAKAFFEAVNRQLARHGYIARGGRMIDASVVEDNPVPADWSPPKRRQRYLDARWTKRHGKSYFGYKLSVNTDKCCKLIRKIKISTASEHDTLRFKGTSKNPPPAALVR